MARVGAGIGRRLAGGPDIGHYRGMSAERKTYTVTSALDENDVWKEFAEPRLRDLSPNVRAICQYGLTEMVNNVVDHSGSPTVVMSLELADGLVKLDVFDNGVGIFQKLQGALGLESEHAAALELAKGRVTTDPARHTGEGIFFTARMFDSFVLFSGEISFHFGAGRSDWWIEDQASKITGTLVRMHINSSSQRTAREVFDRFAGGESDFQFDTTVLLLKLFSEENGHLVSRSQARRLLSRLENFKTVILDFKGIADIGPAFADEVFRVFQQAHPETRITPLNASEPVNRMILRVLTRNGDLGEQRS